MEDVSVHSNSKPVAQITVQGGLPPLFLLKVLPQPPIPALPITPAHPYLSAREPWGFSPCGKSLFLIT